MSACIDDIAPQNQPAWQIRLMRTGDLDQVIKIEKKIYDFPWGMNVFMSCLNMHYENHVIEWGQRIVGYSVMMVTATECHLLNLCIESDFQRCGLGRKLLKLALNRAKSRGVKRVVLEVRPTNQVARNLYNSENFSETSIRKDYYPTKAGYEDALVLTKLL